MRPLAPPATVSRSSTSVSTPCPASARAHASPPTPAPITHASTSTCPRAAGAARRARRASREWSRSRSARRRVANPRTCRPRSPRAAAHQPLHEGQVVEREQALGGQLARPGRGSAGRRACARGRPGRGSARRSARCSSGGALLREVEPPAVAGSWTSAVPWRARRVGVAQSKVSIPAADRVDRGRPRRRCRAGAAAASSGRSRSDQPTTSRICSFDWPSEPPMAMPSTPALGHVRGGLARAGPRRRRPARCRRAAGRRARARRARRRSGRASGACAPSSAAV